MIRHPDHGGRTVAGGGRGEEDQGPVLSEVEIEAIENHDFPPLKGLYWRNARLDFDTLHRLTMSLEARPSAPERCSR